MAAQAVRASADVLLTPELSLTGYPPEDLLLRRAFYDATDSALQTLCAQMLQYPTLRLLVGHPCEREGRRFNAVSLIHGGMIQGTYYKHVLPNYDVFDEHRYFTSDDHAFVFTVNETRFAINICEDAWTQAAPERAKMAGAHVLLVANGSPFHLNKTFQRFNVVQANVSHIALSALYANLVGGQDELVFDGASFVLDANGTLTHLAPQFEEHLMYVDIVDGVPQKGNIAPTLTSDAQAYSALVLGVRDYLDKNKFPAAIVGLSGGIDSALTLAVAVDALGADRVRAVMMPSRYTADISQADAQDMAQRLGVRYDVLPIEPAFEAFLGILSEEFKGLAADTAEENLQARIRGTLLMALSNKSGAIVLTTGNKSEMAVGYCTLYGDMAGGFAVIKDLRKALVYRLTRWRNMCGEVIPSRIITRAPSAELRENQTDQDSLPPYEVLDHIVEQYMEHGVSASELIASGYRTEDVRQVVRLMRQSEYKRRQAPIGIRITHRGFGRDWRYPITNRFKEEDL